MLRKFGVKDPQFMELVLQAPAKEDTNVDIDTTGQSPLSKLNNDLRMPKEVSYHGFEDGFLAMVAVNTDAGVNVAFGRSQAKKTAAHIAASIILERVDSSKGDAVKMLREAASATGSEAAEQAAEALDALGRHLDNVTLTCQQLVEDSPWKAVLTASCQGKLIHAKPLGSKADISREEAIAACGSSFLHQMRQILRIPKDAPNAPVQWAEDLEYRTSKKDMELAPLEDFEGLDMVQELLGTDEDIADREAALEAARERQEQRIEVLAEMSTPSGEGSLFPTPDMNVKRKFHVHTPEEEDWRRDEVKGKLPAERIREQLAKALETKQVVVVSGGTGSGKSTQLPQFILDDFTEWEYDAQELVLEVGMKVEVEYEEEWWDCEVLEVSDDKKVIMAKYFDGGDEEPDIDVKSRVRAAKPGWSKQPPRVVVTQPRRIAATSLAERVAFERYGEVGGEIGHAVRGDTIMPESETGTVEYCTVGTLLRRVVNDPLLSRYNVVILDEIHERDLMTDFLLVLLKEVLPRRTDLRMVLMSATLDVQTFVDYLPGCEVVEVPVGTRYPVEEIHLEDDFFAKFPETKHLMKNEAEGRTDVDKVGSHSWEITAEETEKVASEVQDGEEDEEEDAADGGINAAAIAEQIRQLCCYSEEVGQAWIKYCGGAEEGSDGHRYLDNETMGSKSLDDLLEFLESRGIRPWHGDHASWEVTASSTWWGSDSNDSKFVTLAEKVIYEVLDDMLNYAGDGEDDVTGSILCFMPGWAEIKKLGASLEKSPDADKMWILPLHSQVARDDQQKIFESPPDGRVKVILGTNIAESSVTINDVRVVIDAGLHREMSYDPRRRLSFMETVWVSQSNAVQRKGRAGRVRSGRVFRLYTKDQFESVPWRPAPEMQRCNLAQTCLQTIHLGRDPREFLAKAPDAPPVATVEAAMAELVAIDAVRDGVPPRLLPVGQVLCRIPLEPLLGRAMMLGTLFGVPQTTAALLAVSNGRTPFATSPEQRKAARQSQKDFCQWSDPVAALRALSEFEEIYKTKGTFEAQRWAQYFHLNYYRLLSFSRIKFQLLQDVQRSGLLDGAAAEGLNPEEWLEADEEDSGDAGGSWFQDDSDGAIFESDQSNGLMRNEWLDELRSADREVDNEKLIVGIMCAAFPTNLAVREQPKQKLHQTGSVAKATIDRRSVNCNLDKEDGIDVINLPSPSWWLYFDMRMFNGQVALSDTTSLTDMQVALFGGLRARDGNGLELDNWIDVMGDEKTKNFVCNIRRELRQALTWIAIAASWDRVAQAAAARSMKLFAILGSVLQGQTPNEEDVQYVREFQLPTIKKGESAVAASEEISIEEIEEQLWMKTVVELKALLKELGRVQRGKKADLVTRAAEALANPEDHDGVDAREMIDA